MTLALFFNNQYSQVYTPNATTVAAALQAGNPIPTITPYFISQNLGPVTKNGTMVADINAGLQVTQEVPYLSYSSPRKPIKPTSQP